jgi:hypothetical protein
MSGGREREVGARAGESLLKHDDVDSRMSPDLPRGTGKSIGGDLDVDDEGPKQCRFEPMQSLHHGSVGYQLMHT